MGKEIDLLKNYPKTKRNTSERAIQKTNKDYPKAVYNWIVNNIEKLPYTAKDLRALHCLKSMKGLTSFRAGKKLDMILGIKLFHQRYLILLLD